LGYEIYEILQEIVDLLVQGCYDESQMVRTRGMAIQALLGVVTLDILGLVFNPFDRTLRPMRMLLS
jgi:hypothetical protein